MRKLEKVKFEYVILVLSNMFECHFSWEEFICNHLGDSWIKWCGNM